MKQLPRIIMIIAAFALLSLFFFPLWKITLIAPQYRDGVTLHIYINKIGGATPGTLQNINILNHYIGMKKIVPDAIPELKILPYIVIGLMGFGLLSALINKRQVFLTWVIVFALLSIAGLYDFYLWEYDYGHTLDPKAPMKFPGASFQPPLIGTKNIINFTATSLPHIGGYIAGCSLFLGVMGWWLKYKIDLKNEKDISNAALAYAIDE